MIIKEEFRSILGKVNQIFIIKLLQWFYYVQRVKKRKERKKMIADFCKTLLDWKGVID